ncbi:uncharacterized protein CTHT_0074690 [Thermochaetoides thermophila DSM 1495]|uniref:Uncharacterized protein n=1 Tax=Chaetomium thermophilum (strain DSM 1495 / CBS 144.50 / IMI 039719) TaxID=759272 RepID=G0SI67_CHATD|nr:hypothetical protein CTHT_0074690 [Thermochaetoides thermophila DSM 1495]EGS17137.1 hypothetical protein CTHT_0074690 [Thermochaetoides thermophila DSM 1495]
MAARRAVRRVSRAAGHHSAPSPVPPTSEPSSRSASPSTYASDAEDEVDKELSSLASKAMTFSSPANGETWGNIAPKQATSTTKPFRFMDLPIELRMEIYKHYFDLGDRVIDLDYDNYKIIYPKMRIFWTCRTIYREASHVFYSTHTFRIFPTQPGRFFKTKRPLLARLKPWQRQKLTSLELRLGPGWAKPPKGWVVNDTLGLYECINVRKLTIFVQVDPSDGYFKGFRKADGFYETFSKQLLDGVLKELPSLDDICFDAWSGVKKSGAMIQGLLQVASKHKKRVCWGPEIEQHEAGQQDKEKAALALLDAPLRSKC